VTKLSFNETMEDPAPPLAADSMDDDASPASTPALSRASSTGSLPGCSTDINFADDATADGCDCSVEELPAAAPSEMHLAIIPVRRYTTTPDGRRTFEGVGALYLTGSVLSHVTSPDSEWDRCGVNGDSPSCGRSGGFVGGLASSSSSHRRRPTVWALDIAVGGVVIWLVRAPAATAPSPRSQAVSNYQPTPALLHAGAHCWVRGSVSHSRFSWGSLWVCVR